MYNRRYDKIFRMLRQETAGYAIGKRPPWGSCVLELKNGTGKLLLSVQGLRPLRQGAYGVYLLAGEESIFCGTLLPDAKEGYAALKWDFAPDAIGDGKRAEDIHTVVILAEYGGNGISAPLVTYFAEERDWRAILLPLLQSKKTEETAEPIALQAAEAAVLPKEAENKPQPQKPQQNTQASIAQAQKSSYHGSFQGLLAKFRQELQELEDTGILSAKEVETIRQGGAKAEETPAEAAIETEEEATIAMEMKTETETKTAEMESPAQRDAALPVEAEMDTEQEVERFVPSLFAQNRELQPFGDGEGWHCISLAELTLVAQIPLQWQKAFFFLLAQRRYQHLILQEKADGIWLGLPALYRQEDGEEAKKFGFALFRRVEGEWGYWLARLEKD